METKNVATAKPELTSELLVKLQADKKAAWAKQRSIEDIDSSEYMEAALEVVKIAAAIKAEQAALLKAANDAKLAELRQAEVNQLDEMLAAHVASLAKNATDEQKTLAANLKEAVVNKLLTKFSPAKVTAPAGTSSAAGGGTKYQGIVAGMLAGQSYDQLIAAGFGDGTIRTVQSKEGFKKNPDGTYTKK